jgi:hypothetical protein
MALALIIIYTEFLFWIPPLRWPQFRRQVNGRVAQSSSGASSRVPFQVSALQTVDYIHPA